MTYSDGAYLMYSKSSMLVSLSHAASQASRGTDASTLLQGLGEEGLTHEAWAQALSSCIGR
jgi:hypothetical protein